MLSCCAFAQADLYIFVSRSSKFYMSKHQRHTSEQRHFGSDYARACSMNNGKKLCELCAHTQVLSFDSACAGLSLSPLLS